MLTYVIQNVVVPRLLTNFHYFWNVYTGNVVYRKYNAIDYLYLVYKDYIYICDDGK